MSLCNDYFLLSFKLLKYENYEKNSRIYFLYAAG
jgi:hypothetical protein